MTAAAAKPTRPRRPATARGATPQLALLRGINVGGNKPVPMAVLRELATGLRWSHVATYIQSGNLVFAADLTAAAAEAALEEALIGRFGFAVEVIVRSRSQWQRYAQGTPFPDAEAARPNLLILALSKRPPAAGAIEGLRQHAKAGERIEARGDAIWIDFGTGIGTSKLTPAVFDRVVGSTVTARNWRTVQQLAGLLAAIP